MTSNSATLPISTFGRLPAIFEHHVHTKPNNVALVCNDEPLTYHALNKEANRLAHYLQQIHHIGPDMMVALHLNRSPQMIIALLAVLKAGAAYLPLDPAYPEHRLNFILRDAEPALLLTDTTDDESIAVNTPCQSINLQHLPLASYSSHNLPQSHHPQNLAYVIYTSGSTGRPKGVLVPHQGIYNILQAQIETFQLTDADHILQFASLSFDASFFDILMALGTGATLYLTNQNALLSGEPLAHFLRYHQITVVTLTPSTLQALPIGDYPHLRVINVAGEACPAKLVQLWANGRFFFNLYGPTEATIWSTVAQCQPQPSAPAIGTPIANVDVHVLDDNGNPVPTGTTGHIHIGGIGLTRGYLGHPRLTAANFIPNPFSDGESGARLYRTGDLAYRDGNGALHFMGRADNQVKLRGFRIELEEIEQVLNQHTAVRQTAVSLYQTSPDSYPILIAYILPQSDVAPDSTTLTDYLQQRLPHYMVPQQFITLDSWPTTPNGKLDRTALPIPQHQSADQVAALWADDPISQQVAAIWCNVLHLPYITPQDSFFSLGGHSLASTQIVARIRATFDVSLPLQSLFDNPTVNQLADAIRAADTTQPALQFPPVTPTPRTEPHYPLSFSQERVWFMRELLPDNRAYNAQSSLRLRGKLNIPLFSQALTEIVRRHETLYTIYEVVDNIPRQRLLTPWQAQLEVNDLTHLSPADQETAVSQALQNAYQQVFDVEKLPLLQWQLLKLAPNDHLFIQVEQHFIHDGWSFAILASELKTIYTALVQGQPNPLPPLPVQFIDFAIWQRTQLQSIFAQQLAFWQSRLANITQTAELPTDYLRPPVQTLRGNAIRRIIPPHLARRLRAFSRQHNATLFMTLLTALKIWLLRYTGQTDIVVGTSVANRRLRTIESLIGMIVNNLVLRTQLEGNLTVLELLDRIRYTTLGAYENQDLPFEQIVDALNVPRDLSRNPLFQVMFNFHDAPVPVLDMPDLVGEVIYHQNGSAKFDLNVLVVPQAEQQLRQTENESLLIVWEYNSDLFKAETVERWYTHYERLLELILTHTHTPIAQLPYLATAEQTQLLQGWNKTAISHPPRQPIHTLITQTAQRYPHKIALQSATAQLTYTQLEAQANQLAHHLQANGARADHPILICLPRSPETAVAALAVWKLGSIYVPTDYHHPDDRLCFIAQHTGANLLITTTALASKFSQANVQAINLDQLSLHDYPIDAPKQPVDPEQLAYFIYTSGSTGRPKGVAVTHRSVHNLIYANLARFNPTHEDVTTLLAGPSFDATIWELWTNLAVGTTICIPDEETRMLPQALTQWLTQQAVTLTFLPTPMAEAVRHEDWSNNTTLRYLIAGGDKLHIYPATPLPFTLVNGYGPTEATVFTTFSDVATGITTTDSPPIGRPLHNAHVYILDDHLQPVPVGVAGQLYIAGDGLSLGYWQQARLTAAAFLPNPFSQQAGGRMYHTGDVARYQPDGQITFLGRADNQVQLRGFRIELGEIETILAQHSAVQESLLIATGEGLDKQLIAYLITNTAVSSDDIRHHLKQHLPDYMIPTHTLFLDHFPLTANGKVDRRALPPPNTIATTAEEFAPPETYVEEVLANIWAELLQRTPVGVHDDFFDLGGHSLLAAQSLSHIQQALNVTLSLRDFFDTPTIIDLAEQIEERLLKQLEDSHEP